MAKKYEPIPLIDPETGKEWKLRTEKLVMDARDLLLRSLRQNLIKKPWDRMTEAEQQNEVQNCEDIALSLVQNIVEIIAQGENAVVHAIVDNFQIKNGNVKITASGLAEDDVLLTLNHAGKKAVKIIVTDAEQYDRKHEPVPVDKDEPELFDDGDEDADEQDQGDDDPESDIEQFDDGDEDPGLSPEQQGAGMASHGLPATTNPFPEGTREFEEWKRGYESVSENGEEKETPHDPETGEIIEPEPEAAEDPAEPPQEAESKPSRKRAAGKPQISSGEERVNPEEEASGPTEDEAYNAGYQARIDGIGPSRNPYPVGPLLKAWDQGYSARREEERKAEQNHKTSDAEFED